MAGRKNKNTVDYFPHYCSSGDSKTMFILEQQFGLTGYAVWYKTLELLGKSNFHYIDLRNETDLLFLISKLGISEQDFINIYDLLAKLDAIDLELWNKKIIYSENFINNVEDVYVRRKGANILHKLDLCNHLLIKCTHKGTKESKVKKSKGIYIYTKFYDSEIKKTNNEKYIQFVKYLFGENKLKTKLAGVLSIENQLKVTEFEKVIESCKINNKKLGDILTKIENDKKYFKNKKSLYITLLNWSNDRFNK